MKLIKWLIFSVIIITISGCSGKTSEILICGGDQILIIEKKISPEESLKVLWRWKVSEATGMPEEYQKYLATTDECKPVDGNRKILITSSGGGVALVERKTKRTIFYAYVPNAHSAELLPNDRIAVASSTAADGNSIKIFDIQKPETVIFKDTLYSGHGVVWMAGMSRLFTLGFNDLRSYSLKNWDSGKPELQLMERWILPDDGGHDLVSFSANKFILTTMKGVWVFDTGKKTFSPFTPLQGIENVKSVNYNETTQELVYTKGEISWWTHNIYCKNPDIIINIPDINMYKVRVISKK